MSTHDPATATPDPATPELHLPASLGWYREAANWLVGLATAAIVYGITNIEKLPIQSLASWLYGLMLLAFLVTTISGIVFYFFITEYAHNFLRREKYAALYALSTVTAEQKLKYAKEYDTSQEDVKESARSYRFYFSIMLPSFSIGVLLAFSLGIAALVANKTDKVTHTYKLQAVPVTLLTEQGAMMIDEGTGTSWVLATDSTKQLRWQLVKSPQSDTLR